MADNLTVVLEKWVNWCIMELKHKAGFAGIKDMDQIVEWSKELQSLAQASRFYGHDIYDKERYQRIREVSAEMMLMGADVPAEKIKGLFCGDEG